MVTSKVEIRYATRDRVDPEVFLDVAKKQMYQIRLTGEVFGYNNHTIYIFSKSIQLTHQVVIGFSGATQLIPSLRSFVICWTIIMLMEN